MMTENIIDACVYTCNSSVFEGFSADIRRRIKKIVWTRIDRCVFDDNKTHTFGNALGPLHNNAFSKGCVFVDNAWTHRSIRVHTIFLMRLRMSALKHSKTIECMFWRKLNSTHILKHTRLRYFRPSTLMRHVCVIILIHFLKRFQIDAFSIKTLRFSVDRASGPEVNVN